MAYAACNGATVTGNAHRKGELWMASPHHNPNAGSPTSSVASQPILLFSSWMQKVQEVRKGVDTAHAFCTFCSSCTCTALEAPHRAPLTEFVDRWLGFGIVP